MNATPSEIQRIVALREQGLTHRQVAAEMGITWRRASYLHQTAMREQRRRQAQAAAAGAIVPPREPSPFRPISLPTALRVNGARAAAVQKPMRSMASTPAQEWVD